MQQPGANGGMHRHGPSPAGGLAPWQRRQTEALLRERLDGRIVLSDLARDCGLSTSHFSRAFRRSFGASPHRWLVRRRIERAKELLAASAMPLAEVATACGFADQSHLTHVFTRHLGISPAAWRRTMRG